MSNNAEQKFFNALQEIFVGAEIEGQSGYINLMKIKSRYYQEGVFPALKDDIARALEPFPGFRQEMFDKLYSFFKRYFSESGSIYFRFTPPHEHVYEKVYTDDRDVTLFWKTHMLYYVKTDCIFQGMQVDVDGFQFTFDVASLEHKKANEKRSLVFDFKERRGDGALVFTVTYSQRGKKTKPADIRKNIKAALELDKYTAQVPNEDTLERAFRLFERQSEVDYFINKNARQFLREQFHLWLYQYVFPQDNENQTIWTEKRIRQLQALQEIAYKIIDFIAQFEDELVRIWNKPKFVLDSHYVLTLDRLFGLENGEDLRAKITAHPNFPAQMGEWRGLGMIDDAFTPDLLTHTNLFGEPLYARYRYLPLDTRHFPDLEAEIIAQFDHLDQELDGWLIHSENYQALNTLLPKFREQVQVIYIDPPYNTGNDEFIYADRFRHATWLTMMENRLETATGILNTKDGSIFVSIDDNEYASFKHLMDSVFLKSNFVATIIWQKVFAPKNTAKYFSVDHDYILAYAREKDLWSPYLLPRTDEANKRYTNPDNDPRGDWASSDLTARNYYSLGSYEVVSPSGKIFRPTIGTYWRVSKDTFEKLDADGRIWWGTDGSNMPRLKRYISEVKPGIVPQTLWKHEDVGNTQEAKKELLSIISFEKSEDVLNTVKPTRLLRRIVEISTLSESPSIVLDFFAGGGSTAHAVMNLNREDGSKRKYILVEMGEHFHNVILPRVKKAAFSNQWKDGQAQPEGQGISHFVKYYDMEQYEDTLRRASYRDADLFNNPQADPYNTYVFLRDTKMLDNAQSGQPVLEMDAESEAVSVHLERLYENIDLAETLSCITGKWIRRITPEYVEFEDGERADLQNLDWRTIKPLIWW